MFDTSKKIRKQQKTSYFFNFNKTLTFAKKKGIEPFFFGTTPIEFTPIEFTFRY